MPKTITQKPSLICNKDFDIGQKNWDHADHLAIGQLSMKNLFPTISLEPKNTIDFNYGQALATEQLTFTDPLMPERNLNFNDFLNRRLFNDALLVMHKGKVIHESFRNGLIKTDRHVIHSCTKSLCAMITAMAIDEGLLNVNSAVSDYIPEFKNITAWQGVTVQHVLDMQAGIAYSEDYTDPNADYWSYARAVGYYPLLEGEQAIGARAWAIKNLDTRNFEPGTHFVYNSTLSNVLGMTLENIYHKNLGQLFEEKLYQKVGAEHSAYFNTDPQGFAITEGQLNLTLHDFAKVASLILHDGKNLNGEQVLPQAFIHGIYPQNKNLQHAYQAYHHDDVFKEGQYHNQFWVTEPNKKRFTMLGIHGQFAWFDLEKDLMVVGLGSYPKQDGPLMMATLKTLWGGIAQAVEGTAHKR